MPRPSLGGAARRNQHSIRLNDAEEASLVTSFGSVYKGLRGLVDAHMRRGLRPGGEGDPPVTMSEPSKVASIAPTGSGSVKHRHRPSATPLDERWEGGVKMIQPACTECGQAMNWRKA